MAKPETSRKLHVTRMRQPHKVAKLMRLPGGCLLWH